MSINSNSAELYWLWLKIRREWFPDSPEVDNYRLLWSSRRQKRTLASCNVKLKRVTVARELNHGPVKVWLEPILYHEMCHAILKSRTTNSGRRVWHDARFRALENRHPQIPALNQWIQTGGWFRAVLSDRSRNFWNKIRGKNRPKADKFDISASI